MVRACRRKPVQSCNPNQEPGHDRPLRFCCVLCGAAAGRRISNSALCREARSTAHQSFEHQITDHRPKKANRETGFSTFLTALAHLQRIPSHLPPGIAAADTVGLACVMRCSPHASWHSNWTSENPSYPDGRTRSLFLSLCETAARS